MINTTMYYRTTPVTVLSLFSIANVAWATVCGNDNRPFLVFAADLSSALELPFVAFVLKYNDDGVVTLDVEARRNRSPTQGLEHVERIFPQ